MSMGRSRKPAALLLPHLLLLLALAGLSCAGRYSYTTRASWATRSKAVEQQVALDVEEVMEAEIPLGVGADLSERLVAQASQLHGTVQKQGMVPPERWSRKNGFSYDPFHAWIAASLVRHGPDSSRSPPPMSQPCAMVINHEYRFIFIRNRKAASTAIMMAMNSTCTKKLCLRNEEAMGVGQANSTCKGAVNPKQCLKFFGPAMLQDAQRQLGVETVEQAWKGYFVFTTSRNPWARAASGYDYILSRWDRHDGTCTHPTFEQFTRDPYILGKLQNMYKCKADEIWNFDYYHVEPASPCMTTADGKSAVDYVVRYEHLEEDFAEAVAIINARRQRDLPPLQFRQLLQMKKSSAAAVDQLAEQAQHDGGGGDHQEEEEEEEAPPVETQSVSHAERYRDCGARCITDIATMFAKDLEFLGYSALGYSAQQ